MTAIWDFDIFINEIGLVVDNYKMLIVTKECLCLVELQ